MLWNRRRATSLNRVNNEDNMVGPAFFFFCMECGSVFFILSIDTVDIALNEGGVFHWLVLFCFVLFCFVLFCFVCFLVLMPGRFYSL